MKKMKIKVNIALTYILHVIVIKSNSVVSFEFGTLTIHEKKKREK